MSAPMTTTGEALSTSASLMPRPSVEIEVVDAVHAGRPAADDCVGTIQLGVFHIAVGQTGPMRPRSCRPRNLRARPDSPPAYVFALQAVEVFVDVGNGVGGLVDDEDVGAEIEDLLCDVAVDAVHKGDDRDQRRHRDHDAEQRQDRPQLVRPQGIRARFGWPRQYSCDCPVYPGRAAERWSFQRQEWVFIPMGNELQGDSKSRVAECRNRMRSRHTIEAAQGRRKGFPKTAAS